MLPYLLTIIVLVVWGSQDLRRRVGAPTRSGSRTCATSGGLAGFADSIRTDAGGLTDRPRRRRAGWRCARWPRQAGGFRAAGRGGSAGPVRIEKACGGLIIKERPVHLRRSLPGREDGAAWEGEGRVRRVRPVIS